MFNEEIPATRENLRCGDHVAFDYKGQRFEGLFVSISKRATVVVPVHGKSYIPLRMLWKVKHDD